MNVLQVNKFHWMKGGSEAAYFGLLKLLREHGHSTIEFSMKDPRNLPSDFEQFFVEAVDYESTATRDRLLAAAKIIYSLDARRKMRALLREVTPDVAHFHIFQHQISPSVFGPLRDKGVPLVLTLHDLKPICPNYKMLTGDGICERCKGGKFYHCFLNKCSKGSTVKSLISTIEMYFHHGAGFYRSVDRYVAVSDFYRRKMIEFGFGEKQVVHIPNFIDTSSIELSNEDKGYGLYLGRLSEEKGLSTLLHALSRTPASPFMIVGTGPDEARLKELAASLKLTGTRFCGFKKGAELRELVAGSAFTVIPSEWYENCPMSVLESFAIGKAVIGADIGGIPELIADGVDGFTFRPGDPDGLTEKMRLLWDDPSGRREMGRRGRAKVEELYTPERHYDSIIKLYREL